MRITVKAGLIAAAVWILIKMLFFFNGWNTPEMLPVLIMLNILGILVAIAVGLYIQKRNDTEGSNSLRDIKNAMTAGVPYAVIVSIFLYFYYDKIDPEFNQRLIAEREMAILEGMDTPEELQQIRSSNPDFEVMTKEEIYEKLSENNKTLYTAQFTMTVGLLAMLVLSTFYSILITVIYRKLIFRE